MEDRLLLDKIDYQNGTITLDGKTYPLLDTHFPTIDPKQPYELSEDEFALMEQLLHSFRRSKRLQKHLRCLYQHGSLHLVTNHCLLYHAAIPMNADGSFTEVEVCGKRVKGKALMERTDEVIREAYYGDNHADDFCTTHLYRPSEELDYMWYLWCGPYSPLFGKDKIDLREDPAGIRAGPRNGQDYQRAHPRAYAQGRESCTRRGYEAGD